jgi:hypothetical protein
MGIDTNCFKSSKFYKKERTELKIWVIDLCLLIILETGLFY